MRIMEKIGQLEKENQTFAVATIIESKGSTPRHIGKMIVYPDSKIEGTVGGGLAELYVIEAAIEAIHTKQSKTVSYTLDKEKNGGITMHCGGTLVVFIEVFVGRPELILVGAGHLAQALAQLADFMGYPYRVIDDRPTYCTQERFPTAIGLYAHESLVEAIRMTPIHPRACICIFTKDSDDIALKELIHKEYAYMGMIGSKNKIRRVFEQLENEGIQRELLDKVHTPIGLAIGAETPEEIAISVIAEIISID